jgi:hypothetical protein
MSVTRLVTFVVFATATLIGISIELVSRREGSKVPSLAAICGFVMHYRAGKMPVGRIAMYGFWWWVAWHFFAR